MRRIAISFDFSVSVFLPEIFCTFRLTAVPYMEHKTLNEF